MKMKTYLKLLYLPCVAILFFSCGNADDDVNFNINQIGSLGEGIPVDECLNLGESDLVLSIQDQFTTYPVKYLFFLRSQTIPVIQYRD